MLGYRRALQHGTFAVVPLMLTLFVGYLTIRGHILAVDFHHAYWPAAVSVLHGTSPYLSPTASQVVHGTAFVYPAPAAVLLAPFGLLPHSVADALFALLSIVAALLSLRLCGVRDWRLYGLVMLWPTIISSWQTANLTLMIVLGIAGIWRLRDRPVVSGLLVAVVVSMKAFAWPLAIWFFATRRYRALIYSLVSALAINLVAWTILGYDQISRYTHLARTVTRLEERTGYSAIGLALNLGAGRLTAYAVVLVLAATVAGACLVVGRQGREREALVLCVALCLLATPVVWGHYYALLLVPLALTRPRLTPLWLAPLALYLCPVDGRTVWQLLLGLGTAAGVLALTLRPLFEGGWRAGLRRLLPATPPLRAAPVRGR